MDKKRKKISKSTIIDRAFASWIKKDPLVRIVVSNNDAVRRDIMLNLLGEEAVRHHFKKFPPRKPGQGPIYPSIVRDEVQKNLLDVTLRTSLIRKLIYWATDREVNNRFIDSHLARIQIVQNLLGPIFFHSTLKQEGIILKGLKFMLVKKNTSIGKPGEQSVDVHNILLARISEMLIHNQKVIINKAVSEAEERMRAHLMKQIQEMRGKKSSSQYTGPDMKKSVNTIIKEKFPLKEESRKHLEDMLEYYAECNWPEIKRQAEQTKLKMLDIRKPLTLTSQEGTR